MSSRVVEIFIFFKQSVEFVKVLADSSTVICFLVKVVNFEEFPVENSFS